MSKAAVLIAGVVLIWLAASGKLQAVWSALTSDQAAG